MHYKNLNAGTTGLYYQIAEQIIAIEHPDIGLVRGVLSKYEAFLCSEGGGSPLLSVRARQDISLPLGAKLLEYVEEAYFTSSVYELSSTSFYLVIKQKGLQVEGLVSADWRHLELKADWANRSCAYLIDRLIMICFTMASLPLGYIKVHASVMELGGRALVFMGVSGTGKSTHSRLWQQYVDGASLLNDDEPIVRLMPEGTVRVYGCPWSGSTDCYRNAWAEVVAFVHLYQAKANKLTRLSGRSSFDSLFSSCAFILNQPKGRLLVFNQVARILEHCPVYRLDNLPDKEAVGLTYSLLA